MNFDDHSIQLLHPKFYIRIYNFHNPTMNYFCLVSCYFKNHRNRVTVLLFRATLLVHGL